MSFNSGDYRNAEAFREEEELYSKFWYNQTFSGPGFTWSTEYYYRKMGNGKYRLVMIDAVDNEISYNEELENAEKLVHEVTVEDEYMEYEPYEIDDNLLQLFPEDLQKYPELLSSIFNEKSAGLLEAAKNNNDDQLIKALIPDFETLRNRVHHVSASQFRALVLDHEDEEHNRFYFEVKLDGLCTTFISYSEGEPCFRDEDKTDDFFYIDHDTVELFHEVLESEDQEWERK